MVFNVTETIVCDVINLFWSILFEDFASNVLWLFTAQWRLRTGNWDQIPHAVGTIDRTWHKIERPTVIPQRPLYSGHRHFH